MQEGDCHLPALLPKCVMTKSTNSPYIYNGKFIKVSEEHINGLVWEKAHFRGGVVVYPFQADGKLLLIKEFRPHENPNLRIKAITGIFEPHLSALENACKEMQEEIGYNAKKVEQILHLQSTGTINSFQHFIAAWELYPQKIPNPDGEETIQEILPVKFSEVMRKVRNMEIPWGMTTLGLFKLEDLLNAGKLFIPNIS